MKKLNLILTSISLFILALLAGCEESRSPGLPVSFNDEWLFIRQDSANIESILPGNIPNHKWEEVTLPHTAFIEPLVVTGQQWTGICWYKKIYKASGKNRNKHTGLLFDGLMHDAIIYLNGVEIARHTGGYLPLYVDLSADLKYGQENEILIRLDNRENPVIPPGKPLGELDFLYYSGIYRNVSLFVRDRLHITNVAEADTILGGGILTGFRNVNRDSATIIVSALVSNDDRTPRSFRLRNTLLDAAGNAAASSVTDEMEMEPGQSRRIIAEMKVMKPALWSPDQPFLYTLLTELGSDDEIIDCAETRTGIRTVRITWDQGLILNGNPP